MEKLREVLYDMRRGDVLEILDQESRHRHDSGFDSGFGSQSLSINRSEGEETSFILPFSLVHEDLLEMSTLVAPQCILRGYVVEAGGGVYAL